MKSVSPHMIIGLSSLPGGGKDFVADLLVKEHHFYKVSPGDIIRDLLKRHNKNITREAQQDIQADLRKEYGDDYIMELCYRRILKSGKEKIVIPGIRLPSDVLFYRNKFDGDFINIFIRSSRKIRYARLVKRKRVDSPKSYAEFLRHDAREIKMFDLNKTRRMSDIEIINNSTETFLKSELRKIVRYHK